MKEVVLLLILFFISLEGFSQKPNDRSKYRKLFAEIEELRITNIRSALEKVLICKKIASRNNWKQELVKCYNSESYILSELGRYNNSISIGKNGMKLALEINDSSNYYSMMMSYLQTVSRIRNRVKTEITAFEKAENYYRRTKNKSLLARSLNYQGLFYVESKQYEKALTKFKQASELYKEENNITSYNQILSNLAISYFYTNNTDSAYSCFNNALKFVKDRQFYPLYGAAYNNLGEYHFLMKNLDSSKYYFQKSLEMQRIFENNSQRILSIQGLQSVYEVLKQADSVQHYTLKLLKAKEINWKEKSDQFALDADEAFLLSEKQRKNTLREKVNSNTEHRNAFLKIIFIFGSLFTLLICSVIYVSYRRHRRLNQLLLAQKNSISRKNDMITISLQEKEILFKEIHHRVKNNLQIISSMLSLQMRTQDDPIILEALEESRERIQAIALVHKQLYTGDNIQRVNMEDYFLDLNNQLMVSHKRIEQTILSEIKCNQITFSIDTAVPLGIIVSELFTNTFKHAFKDASEGKILIELIQINENPKRYLLNFADNGVGLPLDFKFPSEGSLGTEIIEALTEQLNGSLTFESSNGGAKFKIEFEQLNPTFNL